MTDVVVNKSIVLVKDDFFDDIINGLSSPEKENKDKAIANNTGIFLSGKQLNRFKLQVLPQITSNFTNSELINEYVSNTRETYEKLRIEEAEEVFKVSFQTIQKYKDQVQEEAEEEEEEDDEKGFIDFLKKCYGWYKIVIFSWKFYKFYTNIRDNVFGKTIPRKRSNYEFHLSNYDLDNELDFEESKNDFSCWLNNTWIANIENLLKPFFIKFNTVILAATDAANNVLNRGFTNWVKKKITIFLIEVGVLALITFATGGAGALAMGARIVAWGNKIRQAIGFFRNSKKIYKLVKKSKDVFNATRKLIKPITKYTKKGIKRFAENKKAQKYISKVGGNIAYHADDIGNVINVAKEVRNIIREGSDFIDIDRKTLQAHEKKIYDFSAKVGQKLVDSINNIKPIVNNGVNDLFYNFTDKVKSTFTKFANGLLRKFFIKYKNVQSIEGLSLDLEQVNNLVYFFEKENDGYKLKNYRDDYGIISIIEDDSLGKYTISKDFSNLLFDGETVIDLKKFENNFKPEDKIQINQQFEDDGRQLLYDKFGKMSGVRLGFIVAKDSEISHRISYISNGVKSETSDDVSVIFHHEGNEIELSIERVWKNEDIKIAQTYIEKSKEKDRIKKSQSVIKNVSIKDLSDIVIPRRKWLESEKKFNSNVQNLYKSISKLIKS